MQQPMQPEFISAYKRLETFKENWPKFFHMRPENLVPAGFYYTQIGDMVQCFYCSIMIKDWAETDNVWVEHRKHSPECFFLTMAGPPCVNDVKTETKETHKIGLIQAFGTQTVTNSINAPVSSVQASGGEKKTCTPILTPATKPSVLFGKGAITRTEVPTFPPRLGAYNFATSKSSSLF